MKNQITKKYQLSMLSVSLLTSLFLCIGVASADEHKVCHIGKSRNKVAFWWNYTSGDTVITKLGNAKVIKTTPDKNGILLISGTHKLTGKKWTVRFDEDMGWVFDYDIINDDYSINNDSCRLLMECELYRKTDPTDSTSTVNFFKEEAREEADIKSIVKDEKRMFESFFEGLGKYTDTCQWR